jgi:hypothetical protein
MSINECIAEVADHGTMAATLAPTQTDNSFASQGPPPASSDDPFFSVPAAIAVGATYSLSSE